MDELKNKFLDMPQAFWTYNWVFALILFLLTRSGFLFSLIFFPFALVIIKFFIQYFGYRNSEIMNYIGVYPLPRDLKSIIFTLIISLFIWRFTFLILILTIILGVYLISKGKVR